jgi:predicted ATPase
MFLDLPEKLNIYDIDPKLSKKGVPMTGKMELEEDGSNLAIVLKNLISKKRSREKLFNLINDMLPFLTDVDIKKFEDKSLFLTIKEKFSGQTFMPGSLISDGTINIIALIIALYFERNSIIVIEEPERNIHPYLLSKLTDMFIDASKNKQIFVTTHNSEIVKNTKPENILLISRDNEGFSTICKPADMEVVKAFIKNEIGIHELFVDNLLENKNEC